MGYIRACKDCGYPDRCRCKEIEQATADKIAEFVRHEGHEYANPTYLSDAIRNGEWRQ